MFDSIWLIARPATQNTLLYIETVAGGQRVVLDHEGNTAITQIEVPFRSACTDFWGYFARIDTHGDVVDTNGDYDDDDDMRKCELIAAEAKS